MLSTLAMYLPQFHKTPENDKWWGEGFTEWTAVKGAEKLFENHNQPRVPLNQNYYNLLEYDTMRWQADLMRKYHLDGMCIYHYWFKDGKRVLERPAENLLRWKDIHMPFCFCWANETWSRTWKKLSNANTWSSIYETKNNQVKNGILMTQSYGREKDWEEHFNYLLPFFKDERYIKLDGKPVFVIFKPRKIFSLWMMKKIFDTLAKRNGFPGIYTIGMEDKLCPGLDAGCTRQPYSAMSEYLTKNKNLCSSPMSYPYDKLWEIIQTQKIGSDKIYLSSFIDYDNTPRMGKMGNIVSDTSPEIFYENFKKLYQKSLLIGNEFIFVNAWNEWGEGMYLEPDEKNKYAYLESLSKVIEECKNKKISGNVLSDEIYDTEIEKKIKIREEHLEVNSRHDTLLDNWMSLRDSDTNFSFYFKKYGYNNVAIYGTGKLGIHLFYELKKSGVKVDYGIDRNYDTVIYPVDVYSPEQLLPKVDAIIITVIDQYAEISKMLCAKMNSSMIPLEEIIEEILLDSQEH